MSKERLTFRGYKGNALLKGNGCSYGKISYDCQTEEGTEKLGAALEKLAEYEDLEERLEKMFGGKLPLSKYVDELEFALKEQGNPHPMNARILTYAESAKWDEYCKLEEQGLLLRLPCKVGDTVYSIEQQFDVKTFQCTTIIRERKISQLKGNELNPVVFCCEEDFNFTPSGIGRRIFLTQSEAEEKLRELEGK